MQVHDHMLDKKGPISETHRTFPLPFNEKLRKKKKYKKFKGQKRLEKTLQLGKYYDDFELKDSRSFMAYQGNFHHICNHGSVNISEDFTLNCKFQHHGDPYLKLGPFKFEELHKNPMIMSLKNFLSEKEMLTLKNLASDNLAISLVGDDKEKSNTNLRTSKQAWISDRVFTDPPQNINHRKLKIYHIYNETGIVKNKKVVLHRTNETESMFKISRRIELATKMNVMAPMASEQFQVANYGLGGQYGLHYDALRYNSPEEIKSGRTNRKFVSQGTETRKNMNLPYSIRMY